MLIKKFLKVFRDYKSDSSSLTIVGVGPGDPSLLTIAAVEAIKKAKVIVFPISDDNKKSFAAKIDNKYKEEKNGAQHFSKVNEDNYVWNFVYDDFGRTKLTTEPDKATHLVYTMEGKDNPQLLKLSEREILDYKKGENNGLSKK